MSENMNTQKDENIEYIRVGNTTYEVASFYDGEVSLMDLIKNALKRDAQAVLRRLDNP